VERGRGSGQDGFSVSVLSLQILETDVLDIASFVPYLILAIAIAVPVVLIRLLAGEPYDVLRLFVRPAEHAWPRGVQEEEPMPWRWDAPSRRPAAPGDR
jgi:hypothetical protein